MPPLHRGRRPHHVQKEFVGTWGISCLTGRHSVVRPASGRRRAEADDDRTREVRLRHSSDEPDEQGRAAGRGVGGAKGGDQGERGSAKHTPDTGPGACDPGAGPRTASCEAAEEGKVHRASPPHQRRHVAASVLRAQAQGRPRRGRYDVGGLRGGSRASARRSARAGPSGNVPAAAVTPNVHTEADGRRRSLAIAALEDKIVQGAAVMVLNAIYEEEFLGFSYGFRPGRGPHDALDALV